MSYTAIAYRLPRFLRRHILHFEVEIEDAVAAFARAAAGERRACARCGLRRRRSTRITSRASLLRASISQWAMRPGITAGSTRSPTLRRCPSATAPSMRRIHIVTIEHLREPGRALCGDRAHARAGRHCC